MGTAQRKRGQMESSRDARSKKEDRFLGSLKKRSPGRREFRGGVVSGAKC